MNLVENYKRYFGELGKFNYLGEKVSEKPTQKNKLTESENKKMMQVFSYFKKQYPNSTLAIKGENVTVNGLVVENVHTFLERNNVNMARILKNFTNKTVI